MNVCVRASAEKKNVRALAIRDVCVFFLSSWRASAVVVGH